MTPKQAKQLIWLLAMIWLQLVFATLVLAAGMRHVAVAAELSCLWR